MGLNVYLNLLLRVFFFLVFLFQNNVFQAQSDSTIAVALTKVEGFGSLAKSFKIIHNTKDCSSYFGIPIDVKESSCFYFSMHPDQELFEKIRNSEPLSRREQGYVENGFDTTLLSKEKINHSLTVFSGIRKNKKIIIFDSNRNEDFSDDFVHEFDLSQTSESEEYWEFFGTPVKLNYERFNPTTGQPVKRSAIVKIIPFTSNLDQLSFDLLSFEHRFGAFNFSDKRYNVSVSNSSPLTDNFSFIDAIIIPEGEKIIKGESANVVKNVGDFAKLDEKDILIKRVSPLGDTLFLKQKKRPKAKIFNKQNSFKRKTTNGTFINTEDYKDQHLLLNFWGTWCGPCVKKIPYLNQLHESISPKELKIIGIAKDDDRRKLKEFIKKKDIKWDNIFEDRIEQSDKSLTHLFEIPSFPTMILFLPNDQGILRANSLSENKALQNYLENLGKKEFENLVPNHSFELVHLIKNKAMWKTANGEEFNEMSVGWKSPLGSSPDYLDHNTKKKYIFKEYNVKLQNYRAIDGDKHIGISVYGCHRISRACREYAQIKLLQPLKKGNKYEVEFWVSRLRNGVTVNNLGAYFSKELLTDIHVELAGYQPQILQKEAIGIKPFVWERISGTFVADDNYEYISIGNFFPDEATQLFQEDTAALKIGYYFLDNIKVELVKENEISNPFDNLKLEETYVLKNLHFASADTVVLEESYPELSKLLSFLQNNSSSNIQIEGHTDNVGKHEFNMELSRKRSKAVASFLIQNGISKKRISSKGSGDLYPIASNQTEAGRKQNRRVEIKIN